MIITRTADGSRHIGPLGYREAGEARAIAPFRLFMAHGFYDPVVPLRWARVR